MLPLYRAVVHGCRAGRYENVDDLYWKRIRREEVAFSTKKIGAFGADLASISGFFEKTWSQPVGCLKDNLKSWYLGQSGMYLRALGRLNEAAQPMKASLENYIVQNDWKNTAIAASNLSELSLSMGDIAQALDNAKQSVEFADRSGDVFWKMACRTILVDALYQAGRMNEAETLFYEAEKMQKKRQPEYPLLYSFWGFCCCDLLLGIGKYKEVLNRAEQTLEWFKAEYPLLDIALDHLSLGRAHLLQALHEGTGDLSQATEHLNQSVDWLRRAGQQQELPRGLLARAELYIAQKDFDKARRDLDEAATIAERGEMGLHKADCRLGYARLFLATGDMGKARGELAIAKEMIEKMGYHRRDGEVKELEERLKL